MSNWVICVQVVFTLVTFFAETMYSVCDYQDFCRHAFWHDLQYVYALERRHTYTPPELRHAGIRQRLPRECV